MVEGSYRVIRSGGQKGGEQLQGDMEWGAEGWRAVTG